MFSDVKTKSKFVPKHFDANKLGDKIFLRTLYFKVIKTCGI